MTELVHVLVGFLAMFFGFASFVKLTGYPRSVHLFQKSMFDVYGLNRMHTYAIGFAELCSCLLATGYIVGGSFTIGLAAGTSVFVISSGALFFHLRYDGVRLGAPAIVTLGVSGFLCWYFITDPTSSAHWDQEKSLGFEAPAPAAGSGYHELEGRIVNYRYDAFGGFELAFYDGKLKWRGVGGYFDGVVAQVEPQISKVSERVYFMSWPTGPGGDNVVMSIRDGRIYAHLDSGNEAPNRTTTFDMIHGVIECGPRRDCSYPTGAPTPLLWALYRLGTNASKFGLEPMSSHDAARIDEHMEAEAALDGRVLRYRTPQGAFSLSFDGQRLSVGDPKGGVLSHRLHATKVGARLYLVSWRDEVEGAQHLLFNGNTMRVYTHIQPDGSRREEVYGVDCFGRVSDCS